MNNTHREFLKDIVANDGVCRTPPHCCDTCPIEAALHGSLCLMDTAKNEAKKLLLEDDDNCISIWD